jgi:hypothetical protein
MRSTWFGYSVMTQLGLVIYFMVYAKEKSVLIAAASQSTGPLAFGGLHADNEVLCPSLLILMVSMTLQTLPVLLIEQQHSA